MILFHGTTVSNAKNIVKNGFEYNDKIWSCSEEKTYFFTSEFITNEFGIEDMNDILHQGIQYALEQSMITLAVLNPKDYRGAVLVFDTALMDNQDDIEPDTSCPNMENTAVALSNPDMKGLIGFYVMENDMKAFRYFTLGSMMNNDYLEEVELNSAELRLIESLSGSNALGEVFDIISEVSYVKQKINQQSYLKVA